MTSTTPALTTRPHHEAPSDRRMTPGERNDTAPATVSARRLLLAGVLTHSRPTSSVEAVAVAEIIQRAFLAGRAAAARSIEDLLAATADEWESLDDLDRPGAVEREWYLDALEDSRKAAAGEAVL